MSRKTKTLNKYPVFIRFIVQNKYYDKFGESIKQIVEKHNVENIKIVSVSDNFDAEEECIVILRVEVPTNVKKEAEKYLFFTQDVFAKLGVDFYPAYIENPQVRR
jgi:hypothetical protein